MPFNRLISGYQKIEDDTCHEQHLNNGFDSSYVIYGYSRNRKYTYVYNIISILLLGIPYLVHFWYPKYKVIKYKKTSLEDAALVLLYDTSVNYSLIDIITENHEIPSLGTIELRYFVYRNTKYVWIQERESFGIISELIPESTLNDIIYHSHGLQEREEEKLLKLYGFNKIEVKVKTYWQLFIDEVFNPYYVFQIFSMILWCCDNYVIYAGCIFVLTLFSIISGLLETRKQSQSLHDLVESFTVSEVQILRRNLIEDVTLFTVDPKYLVPGDLLVIPKTGFIMPCDAVLIRGTCIVNESMLTGESVPVTKTPPHESDDLYNSMTHRRHTLFSGTHVIQTRYYNDENVIARVVKTGFDTTKGSLVKSIMYPSSVGLKFYRDSMKFVLFLFVIAAFGMGYSLYLYIERQAEISDTIIRTLDIITIVVPPALPAAITVATVYSQTRLKKIGIFCISPPRINLCGRINLACFDKTGTLTEDGLDLYSVVPSENIVFSTEISDPRLLSNTSPFIHGMATCHSLTRINGVLTGDPLDLNMFENIDWELEEVSSQEHTNYDVPVSTIVKPKYRKVVSDVAGGDTEVLFEIGVLRIFQFSSEFQCMSVICRKLNVLNMTVYTKGAPEKIVKLCQPSTVPSDFSRRLSYYTASGKRVIAIAYKELPSSMTWKDSQKIKRDSVESDLVFLGLIVMQNTLKYETIPILSILRNANIRTVMITGDNIETAVSVARNCGMVLPHERINLIKVEIDSITNQLKLKCENMEFDNMESNIICFNSDHYYYAMDGNTWSELCAHFPDLLPLILLKTTVFARFQPDQKAQVVTHLQNLDYTVCMVGDGANDCGALKAAHVGVSLSQTEASVAAPFTSIIENISCVVHLILEGRCALVTSFAEIKYMAMYSLIQFFTVLLLYKRFSILGDTQFLYIDLVITTTFALAIGRQGPSKNLVPQRPLGSLVSLLNLVPLLMQMIICVSFQIAALYYLTIQPWFEPIQPEEHEVIKSWDNTVLFLVSCFQYIIMAFLYSKGKPYRDDRMTNPSLLLSTVILSFSVIYLCICPAIWIADFFEILRLSQDKTQVIFRYTLLVFPLVQFLCAVFVESAIADRMWFRKFMSFICCKGKSKRKYELLFQEDTIHSLLNTNN